MARTDRATKQTAPARTALVIPQYLNSEQLATVLNQKVRTIRYWHRVGYGPKSVKIGRSVQYAKAEVEKFCADPEGYQAQREKEINW